MNRGQSIFVVVTLTSAITGVLTWAGNYFLGSPAKAADATAAVDMRVTETNNKLNILCNDYGQTVSRMDQNMQAIGKKLGVAIVVGKANNDPCKP